MDTIKKVINKTIIFVLVIIGMLLVSCQDSQKQTYHITFDLDGGVLLTGTLEQTVQNITEITIPTTTKNGYKFVGWDKEIHELSKDEVITALWEKIINEYWVTFYDADNNIINRTKVFENSEALAPAAPIKEGYRFIGWDQKFDQVTKDLEIKPLFEKITHHYQVTFLDIEGNVIKEELVEEGTAANPPKMENYPGYTFVGWDQPIDQIVTDTTVQALYEKVVFTVTFKADTEVIETQRVAFEESAITPPIPQKDGFVFMGWDKNYDQVRQNLVVNACFRIEGKINVKLDLGKEVYNSKNDLFRSFFRDFYNFIDVHYGLDELKSHNINSLNDFYTLASSMTWKENDTLTHTQMRGIGNIASKYFLVKDIGGSITNQPTTHFVGYCYQNNMYVDFLLFQIDFFAWWREDEGYTTPTNNGSDFFAEAWAPLVDLGKFFYYNENTSYVKSARVRDCFINIASVVKCESIIMLDEMDGNYMLPMDLSRRGYTFKGWYTTSGQKVTMVDNFNIQERIVTYLAKWEKK